MVNIKKLCFIDLTMETCTELKGIINAGYVLHEFPTKPELKYTRFDNSQMVVKVGKCKTAITDIKKQECLDAFVEYNKGESDHLFDELGKLIAITGATLSKREEQLYILKQVFAQNKGN